ncbi:MAG: hypothetical protein OEQ24_11505 [Gammaproteobacteria bacterium]|nr:hypothetical protein [Gammaproteobacteria bacterium]
MPLADKPLSRDRFQFYDSLSKKEIKKLISNSEIQVLQTSTPVDINTWNLINQQLLLKRPDIEIRIYGHYSQNCDLSFLENLPNVRCLSVDCLINASNIEAIASLEQLRTLSVGVYSLESFDFLAYLPITLKKLFLGSTKSKKPSLEHIYRFSEIEELYIEGQQKNIEVIGKLSKLQKLVLRSVSPKNISFINELKELWSLDIKLGGITDISHLKGLSNLKYLELWQIRGISDISVISTLTGLQYLFLQSLRNVVELPDMSKLYNLRRVYMETMKGLANVDGVFNAPNLEEFIHVCAQNMSPIQYQPLMKHESLKRALFGFGSDKKNDEMLRIMKENHIGEYKHTPFVYS